MQYLFYIIILLFLPSCKEVPLKELTKKSEQNPIIGSDTLLHQGKLIYRNGLQNHYYEIVQEKAQALNIGLINRGFDSLQIRFWKIDGLFGRRELYLIKRTGREWSGLHYVLQVEENYGNGIGSKEYLRGPEPFLIQSKHPIKPSVGWEVFFKNLESLSILTLPDQDEVNGIPQKLDGDTYVVEIATQSMYRIYTYPATAPSDNSPWQMVNAYTMEGVFQSELQ